jgi:2-polyprenyl-3-methyl-5-hydroxy-6-metoxy-1,4-benzoquinol methylase
MLRRHWQDALLTEGEHDPLDSALHELAVYFDITVEEARKRCEQWESDSVVEWEMGDRTSTTGLLDFYRTTRSWIFDTVWYHAKQCSGEQFPESVAIAYALRDVQPGHLLDFGAGPGSTGLFFSSLGWQVSMADISTSMQSFARWRFDKRGIAATFYDTTCESLPAETFDVITAIDVVAHIPDWPAQARHLYRALTPGGRLIFNIDARPRARENQWHLYRFHFPILRPMRRIGFEARPRIEFFYVYAKDGRRSALPRLTLAAIDTLRYNRAVSFAGQIYRKSQIVKARLKHN